jgi:23S rRNA (guanosine2251-2'-O)-methyltransferase
VEVKVGMESEFIGGRHSVIEALRSGRPIHKIWIAEGVQKGPLQAIFDTAKQAGIIIQQTDKRKCDELAQGIQHQGVVAQVAAYSYAEVDDLFNIAQARGEDPFFIILDEIEDPHNLGSIIRTAECAGAHGVIIPKRRAVGLTATVSKISAGAAEHVAVARVTNLAQTIDELKKRGVWVAASDVNRAQDVYSSDLRIPIAIVIGNEGKGVGRLIKERCDFIVKLPMQGRINSLNASVAAALLMYEVVRQRGVEKRG